MPTHSDRRLTLQWAKIGPPQAVASGNLSANDSDCVALLDRATSPASATLLAEKLPDAIPVVQPNVIWL